MEFKFNINDVFKQPVVEINNNLIPPGFSGDRRALWDTVNKVSEVINAVGEASAVAQGLSKPITTAERLRNSEHRLYFLIDQDANDGKGAVAGMLKTGSKGLYVFDRDGQHYQVSPSCVLDFYVHESRQRTGLGRQLFEHMLQKEGVEPVKMALDRPSEKLLGFLNKHYALSSPVKQMNNYVVFDGFFPKSAENGNTEEPEKSAATPGKRDSANGLQSHSSAYGRYGAPRPPCSMGQIIHNQTSTINKRQEPTGVQSMPVTNYLGAKNSPPRNSLVTQSAPNVHFDQQNQNQNANNERVNYRQYYNQNRMDQIQPNIEYPIQEQPLQNLTGEVQQTKSCTFCQRNFDQNQLTPQKRNYTNLTNQLGNMYLSNAQQNQWHQESPHTVPHNNLNNLYRQQDAYNIPQARVNNINNPRSRQLDNTQFAQVNNINNNIPQSWNQNSPVRQVILANSTPDMNNQEQNLNTNSTLQHNQQKHENSHPHQNFQGDWHNISGHNFNANQQETPQVNQIDQNQLTRPTIMNGPQNNVDMNVPFQGNASHQNIERTYQQLPIQNQQTTKESYSYQNIQPQYQNVPIEQQQTTNRSSYYQNLPTEHQQSIKGSTIRENIQPQYQSVPIEQQQNTNRSSYQQNNHPTYQNLPTEHQQSMIGSTLLENIQPQYQNVHIEQQTTDRSSYHQNIQPTYQNLPTDHQQSSKGSTLHENIQPHNQNVPIEQKTTDRYPYHQNTYQHVPIEHQKSTKAGASHQNNQSTYQTLPVEQQSVQGSPYYQNTQPAYQSLPTDYQQSINQNSRQNIQPTVSYHQPSPNAAVQQHSSSNFSNAQMQPQHITHSNQQMIPNVTADVPNATHAHVNNASLQHQIRPVNASQQQIPQAVGYISNNPSGQAFDNGIQNQYGQAGDQQQMAMAQTNYVDPALPVGGHGEPSASNIPVQTYSAPNMHGNVQNVQQTHDLSRLGETNQFDNGNARNVEIEEGVLKYGYPPQLAQSQVFRGANPMIIRQSS